MSVTKPWHFLWSPLALPECGTSCSGFIGGAMAVQASQVFSDKSTQDRPAGMLVQDPAFCKFTVKVPETLCAWCFSTEAWQGPRIHWVTLSSALLDVTFHIPGGGSAAVPSTCVSRHFSEIRLVRRLASGSQHSSTMGPSVHSGRNPRASIPHQTHVIERAIIESIVAEILVAESSPAERSLTQSSVTFDGKEDHHQ